MSDLFREPDDATPLAPSERDGLLQSWITHRSDLNEAEQENILKGAAWARGRRGRKAADLLTDEEREELIEFVGVNPELGDAVPDSGGVRSMQRVRKRI